VKDMDTSGTRKWCHIYIVLEEKGLHRLGSGCILYVINANG